MKPNTPELMKFKRLQRRLNVGVAQLVGHLELLWISTAKNAPEGDIGRFTDEDIAIACHWDGDPTEFVVALVDCGWLDRCEQWRLVVHDWDQHAPTWVIGNLKRHGRSLRGVGTQPTKEVTKELTKQVTKELTMEGPTSPILSSPILSNLENKEPEVFQDVETSVVIPEWMYLHWVKYIECWRLMHGNGRIMPQPMQEAMILRLSQLGQEKALADLQFMIERATKGYCDSSNDRQKRSATQLRDRKRYDKNGKELII